MKRGDRTLKKSLGRYCAYLAVIVFLVYGYYHLNLPLMRIPEGLLAIGDLIFNKMLPPDVAYASRKLPYPLLETMAMAIVGSFIGVSLSVPLAWFAAFNLTPNRRILYPIARLILVVSRSIHEIVWAMLLVSIFGFGPLPGMLTLIFIYIGFAGKLFSENIEAIDMGTVDAMRAVGANRVKEMCIGVIPQVMPVWAGIAIYGWDVALRASSILGLVGAGGLGTELRASIESLRYSRAGAILIIILCLVSLSELASEHVRKRMT
jgi:phosphonate transport system permease protein